MKRTILILAAIAILTGAYLLESPAIPQNGTTLTVYDSAVLILKDFVVKGGDKRLGFKDEADFEGAWLDTSRGLKVMYLRHDTMTTTLTRMDSELVALDRTIYPVFTTVNGNTKLHSAITFDSAGGWHPIIFEDSTILVPYIAYHAAMRALNRTFTAKMVMIPQIENHAIVTRSEEGTKILPRKSLKLSLNVDLPGSADSLTTAPIGEGNFMKAISNRLLRASYRNK